jgi:hypothetical protein
MTTCIECGCTDGTPCVEGSETCRWTQIDGTGIDGEPGEFGVCSFCDDGTDMYPTAAPSRPSGLILPGDPEFHL